MSGEILVGKTLTGLMLAKDKKALLFQTTGGDILVRVDADCCSYTWVEHIELPALGFPAEVVSVENLDLPQDTKPEDADKECVAYYGCKITTSRGEIVIDYRNDSNGYYGGGLSWPVAKKGDYEHFYGGVYGQNVSKLEWEAVT